MLSDSWKAPWLTAPSPMKHRADPFWPLYFKAVAKTEAERGLAGDDAVATPEVLVRSKEVHRSAFAFGAAGGFTEKLGHAFVHVHPNGQGVCVTTVSR